MAAGLRRSIWVSGLVNLLMDVSFEMIHGLMPVFLMTVLGLCSQELHLPSLRQPG